MPAPLSEVSSSKLRKELASASRIDDLYEKLCLAIKADPESMISAPRIQELSSLKLAIPERIKTLKFARRQLFASIEDVKEELRTKDILIALAVRQERDSITDKPKYSSPTLRDAAELEIRGKDAVYQSLIARKRKMFSLLYGYDEDIEYLERIDVSLLEIIALVIAQMESYNRHAQTRTNTRVPRRKQRRSYPGGQRGTPEAPIEERGGAILLDQLNTSDGDEV